MWWSILAVALAVLYLSSLMRWDAEVSSTIASALSYTESSCTVAGRKDKWKICAKACIDKHNRAKYWCTFWSRSNCFNVYKVKKWENYQNRVGSNGVVAKQNSFKTSILAQCLSNALSLWPNRSRTKFEKTSQSANVSLRFDLAFGQNTTFISVMAE